MNRCWSSIWVFLKLNKKKHHFKALTCTYVTSRQLQWLGFHRSTGALDMDLLHVFGRSQVLANLIQFVVDFASPFWRWSSGSASDGWIWLDVWLKKNVNLSTNGNVYAFKLSVLLFVGASVYLTVEFACHIDLWWTNQTRLRLLNLNTHGKSLKK